MDIDIRLSVEFFDHPKTVKLKRRIGMDGVVSLLHLWLWCRVNRPSGELTGMDAEDIEIAARWEGEPGTFVNESLTLRWLELNDEVYTLHDWCENNSWAAKSEERSNAARLSRMAKTHPELHKKLVDDGYTGITKKEYQELTKSNNERSTVVNGSLTPAPAPAPTPTPAHNAKEGTPTRFRADAFLSDYCEDKQLIKDWLAVRNKKRLANTQTAMNAFIKQVDKSGMTCEQVLQLCCERGWGGFNASWEDVKQNKPINIADVKRALGRA